MAVLISPLLRPSGIGLLLWLITGVVIAQVGEVEQLTGQVHAFQGQQALRVLSVSAAVFQDDTVRTGDDSSVILLMNDGSRLSLESGTSVAIESYSTAPPPEGTLGLLRGRLRSVVTDTFSRRRNAFRVRTTSAVIGVQGTDFLVEAFAASTRVTVYDGVVEVISADPNIAGQRLVQANQTLLIRQGEPLPSVEELGQRTTNDSSLSGNIDYGLSPGSGGEQDRRSGGLQNADPRPGGSLVAPLQVPPLPNPPR